MKAVRLQAYGGAEQLKCEETPDVQAGEGQVLVRVHAASVNPVDYKMAAGKYARLELPWVPGADFSGVIEALGPGVAGLAVGEAVFGDSRPTGAYAELVTPQVGHIARKPEALSHAEAAAVPVAGMTAWQGLFDQGQLVGGQTVLIQGGSGGVGSFAVQLARWKGARVLATASEENLDYVRALGADEAIDYHQIDYAAIGRDVDLVLDLVGGETQERSFGVLKPGGRLVSALGPPPAELASEHKVEAMGFRMTPSTANLEALAQLLVAGTIKAFVSGTYPLCEAGKAWQAQMAGHVRGKLVLEIAAEQE